jgi:hypothetical protein
MPPRSVLQPLPRIFERKLAKEVQSSETAKLTGMRERVAAFFKFYDHASIFV